MNRRTWLVACLMTLALTATAWSQSTGTDTATVPGSSDGSVTAGDTSGITVQPQSLKQQLRAELSQVIVDEIHNFFQDLRTFFGLPAEPTDPTTDPLAILETTVTTMVENKLTN